MIKTRTSLPSFFPAQISSGEVVVFIYAWMAMQGIVLFADREILWGIDNVFFRFGQSNRLIENAVLRLYYIPEIFPWVYYTHIAACLAALLDRGWAFIPRMVAWATGLLLYNAAAAAYGWSMPLMMNMTFIGILMHTQSKLNLIASIQPVLIWLMRMQGLIFLSACALYQWGASQWILGDAFYYRWHLDFNLRECWHSSRASWLVFSKVITYGWMGFCSLFPIVIWFKKMRSAILIGGLVLTLVYLIVCNNAMNALALPALLLPWLIQTKGQEIKE